MNFINNVQKCQELFFIKLLQKDRLSEIVRTLGALYDNARPHTAHATQELMQSLKWEKYWPIHHTAQTLHQATVTCFLN
jgi:hypothetical protein